MLRKLYAKYAWRSEPAPSYYITKVKKPPLTFACIRGCPVKFMVVAMARRSHKARDKVPTKNIRSNGFLRCSPACTLPRYFAKSNYCNCGQAALVQVAWATIGAACAAWSFLWMTPSSFEQKEFTPVVLKEAGAPPAV
jgi:hypothetical protein